MEFLQCYNNLLQYLESRFDFSENNIYSKLEFINLNDGINYENYLNASKILNVEIDEDMLYEETNILKPLLESINMKYGKTIEKWNYIFTEYKKSELKNLYKIVSFILSIPSSNCYTERIFSQMSMKWTDTRNKCSVNLIKSELQVKFNYEFDCLEFYSYHINNKQFLKSCKSSTKYS